MKSEFLDKNILQLVLNALFGKQTNGIKRSSRRVNIEIVIAVNSCDFFDNIGLERNILCCSPARNINGEIVAVKLNLKSECSKGLDDSVVVNFNTRITVNKFLVEAKLNIVKFVSILIRKARCYLYARIKVAEKLNKTGNGCNRHFGVKALFVAHGGVGSVSKTSRGFSDRNSVKGCRLKRKRVRIVNDFRIKSAHDTCDGDGCVVVANHQRVLVNVSFNAVKGFELKRGIKSLDSDFLNPSGVESVHRLTHFKHEIVGQVGEEVDRSHSAVIKTDSHVRRADISCDIFKLKTGISVAEGILNLHVHLRQILILAEVNRVKLLERSACQSGKLSCNSVVTPKVGTVRQRLVVNLKNNIVNGKNILDVRAVCKALVKLHNARIVVAHADFLLRAAHTV